MSADDIYKRFHLYDVVKHNIYESDIIKKVKAAGAKWLILHEDWTVIQNYGLAYDEEKFREFVKKAHSFGLKVMTYFGYEYSSLAPDFSRKADYCYPRNEIKCFEKCTLGNKIALTFEKKSNIKKKNGILSKDIRIIESIKNSSLFKPKNNNSLKFKKAFLVTL